jgi:hypothetical protein
MRHSGKTLSATPASSAVGGLDRYRLCLLGPILLGASVGLQITVAALMLLGPFGNKQILQRLSPYGQAIAFPEQDLPIYALGAAITLAAALLAARFWLGCLSRVSSGNLDALMTFSALLQGILAVVSFGSQLLMIAARFAAQDTTFRQPLGPLDGFAVLVPAVLAVVCVALDLRSRSSRTTSADGSVGWLKFAGPLFAWVTPIFIVAVVWIPLDGWSHLAGRTLQTDWCHHLNFFMMGPALSFAHGRGFGSEIYSQYGIGWPLLLALSSPSLNPTYANLLGMAVTFGCLYYLALFFLLRRCFGHSVWAALGVTLAINWQLFSGVRPHDINWMFPSSTMLRHPMDLGFFFALIEHQRSGRSFWIGVAGLCCALGLFFVTETGIYLLLVFPAYWLLRAGLASTENPPTGRPGWLPNLAVFYGATAAVLLPLLFYASRGTLFSSRFISGWLEALVRYGSLGLGAIPFAALSDDAILFFSLMFTVYLALIGYAASTALRREARWPEIMLATVSMYGLGLLVNFVSRSHPYNLFHPSVPFAVVLTAVAFQAWTKSPASVRQLALPWLCTAGLMGLLLTKSEFLDYPSLGRSFFAEFPPPGLMLRPDLGDLSGLQPGLKGFADELSGLTTVLRRLAPDGKGIAVVDFHDTLIYWGARAEPWWRFTSVFHMALTEHSVNDLQRDLGEKPPKFVVIRGNLPDDLRAFDFVWKPTHDFIKEHFQILERSGSYEIWARPGAS